MRLRITANGLEVFSAADHALLYLLGLNLREGVEVCITAENSFCAARDDFIVQPVREFSEAPT